MMRRVIAATLPALALVACGPAARGPSRPSLDRLPTGGFRVTTLRGAGIDVAPRAADSTLALVLRPGGTARPATVLLHAATARRFADDAGALVGVFDGGTGRRSAQVTLERADGALALVLARTWQWKPDGRLTDSVIVEGDAGGEAADVVLAPHEVFILADALRAAAAQVDGGDAPEIGLPVDRPVTAAVSTCSPRYPVQARMRGLSGEVVARFVVTPEGNVAPGTLHILRTTDLDFAASVRDASACFRFVPAMRDGKPVREVVTQPFYFEIARPSRDDGAPGWLVPPDAPFGARRGNP